MRRVGLFVFSVRGTECISNTFITMECDERSLGLQDDGGFLYVVEDREQKNL